MRFIDPDGLAPQIHEGPPRRRGGSMASVALRENVSGPAKRGNDAAANTFELKVGAKFGLGTKFQMGGVGFDVGVTGPSIGLKFNGSGTNI